MALLEASEEADGPPDAPPLSLPFARRDLDRLRLLLAAQSRLRELPASPRLRQLLAGRGYIDEALRWMEIHGGVQGQELAAYWRSLDLGDVPPPAGLTGPVLETAVPAQEAPPRRPRRRRRRRPRPRPPVNARVDEGTG
jgi:hypothetical protein